MTYDTGIAPGTTSSTRLPCGTARVSPNPSLRELQARAMYYHGVTAMCAPSLHGDKRATTILHVLQPCPSPPSTIYILDDALRHLDDFEEESFWSTEQ